MDQPTNPLERILDLAHSDNNLFSLLQQENSHNFEPFSLFGGDEAKNQQKNEFFAQSPNPFKKDRKNSHQLAFQFKPQNNRSQENFFHRKINFDEDQNMLKWFNGQRQSQVCFPSSLFSPKKRDYQQFSSPHKQERISKEYFQVQSRFLKNERGLKNLSEGMYEVLKKTEKITFHEVASELIKDIKQKALEEGKQMLEKDEKNIRRRAYDALNVLISAGVIEKIDKFIALNKKFKILKYAQTPAVKSKKLINLKELQSQLQEKVHQKNIQIQKKKQDLKTLIERKKNIEKFFKQKKISQQVNDNQKIRFPFLCIKTTTNIFKGLSEQSKSKHQSEWQKQNSLTCDEQKGRNCVFLNFACKDIFKGAEIEGDIDFAADAGELIEDKEDLNVK